jgi:hypothetical protein
VINGNRKSTGTFTEILQYISGIEEETNLKITGLVNNTHMLRETKVEDIMKGYNLCNEVSNRSGIPLKSKLIPLNVKAITAWQG